MHTTYQGSFVHFPFFHSPSLQSINGLGEVYSLHCDRSKETAPAASPVRLSRTRFLPLLSYPFPINCVNFPSSRVVFFSRPSAPVRICLRTLALRRPAKRTPAAAAARRRRRRRRGREGGMQRGWEKKGTKKKMDTQYLISVVRRPCAAAAADRKGGFLFPPFLFFLVSE